MHYVIKNETAHRIRVRLPFCPLTGAQQEVLDFALGSMEEISRLTFYPSTGGLAIEYTHGREKILKRLATFHMENVPLMARTLPDHISLDEMKERRLDPAVKARLRLRIVAESAADMLLPAPMQLAYHIYQLITLKDI